MSSAACSFATVCASSSTSSPPSGSKRSLHALCEDRRMQTLESLFGLAGRTALVTGGSRGIGRDACLGIAQAGAAVAVHYGSDAAAAAGVVAEIETAAGRAVAVGADLTCPELIIPMLDEVGAFAVAGGLHVLVNNAGIYPPGSLESTTVEEWDRVFALNARAPFLVTQSALPRLRR